MKIMLIIFIILFIIIEVWKKRIIKDDKYLIKFISGNDKFIFGITLLCKDILGLLIIIMFILKIIFNI